MDRPRLLDLFCGAGGAAKGYQESGFYVVGVDIKSQPHYCGEEFIQADALTYLAEHGREYDAIHASPPCQGYSIMHNLPWLRGREYPLLILPTLELLEATGKPYVLENVMGARHGAKGLIKRGIEAHGLRAGWLCGGMFGLPFYRHRLFATNWFWLAPGHPKHQGTILKGRNLGDRAHMVAYRQNGAQVKRHGGPLPKSKGQSGVTGITGVVAINDPQRWNKNGQSYPQHAGANWRKAAEAMEINWMTRAELTQAIPPAYTRFLGARLMEVVMG